MPVAVPAIIRKILVSILLLMALLCAFDRAIFQEAARVACMVSLASLWGRPTPWNRIHVPLEAVPVKGARSIFLLGLLTEVLCLIYLEWRQPYYFTQADTHSQFFPVILEGMRSLFEDGLFPTWNGYQYLGMPTASLGYNALTYPVTYLCYLLSEALFGNGFATIEVFGWLHFLVGYAICYVTFRRLHVRPLLACAASLCFVLSGYNLTVGRSWYYMLPVVAWLPALGYLLVVFLYGQVTLRWMIATALTIGLFFHAGNVQMWCYAVTLWGIGIAYGACCKPGTWRNMIVPGAAAVGGLGIAMPLLIVQAMETASISRHADGSGIGASMKSMLLPWPVVESGHWHHIYHGVFLYSGSVFMLAFLIKCALDAAYLGTHRLQRRQMMGLVFSLLAVIALILAMGPQGRVWGWLAHVPPFSRFRFPYKILPFITFYATISGALALEALGRNWRFGNIATSVAAATATGLILYNATLCDSSMGNWADRPYPPLLPEEKPLQAEGFTTRPRGDVVAPFWSPLPGYSQTLGQNYPTVYHIPVVLGFGQSSLEEGRFRTYNAAQLYVQDRNRFYKEYGVAWLLVSDDGNRDSDAVLREYLPQDYELLKNGSHTMVEVKTIARGLTRYDRNDADVKPLAYVAVRPGVPLPYKIMGNGVIIDTRGAHVQQGNRVVANFLYYPWFAAFGADGSPLAITPDDMGRMMVAVRPEEQQIRLVYQPPWRYGIWAGLALLMIASGIAAAWKKGGSTGLLN